MADEKTLNAITETEPAQAVNNAIEAVTDAIDDAASHQPEAHNEHHTDVVALPVLGDVTLPGGIYTAVFIALGIFTLVEVLTAEAIPDGSIKIAALMGIAVVKAVLVIWFYMHLNRDGKSNPLLFIVLLLPIIVTGFSIWYLLGVPSFGGLGYGSI